VLSPELVLADLDARHWTNWWRLLVPPRVLVQPAWALVIVESERPIRAFVSGRGAADHAALSGTLDAAAWARALGVAAAVVLERGVIGDLSAEIEGALRLDQDPVEQGLVALRALKRHARRGVWTEPPLLDILPAPGYEPIQRTFDLLVPDKSALLAYVVDDDRQRVHASIIATKHDGDITHAATHRALADLVPETSFARDWDKGWKRVLAAVEERFAKPSIGIVLERATLLRVLTGPSDQLARELNAKKVIIDPAPAWLLGLLSGAAVAAMAGRAATAIASMLPRGARDAASAVAARARDVLNETGAHPFALLGFDPIELWQRLKHFYRQ
jgi:hypothetical protein